MSPSQVEHSLDGEETSADAQRTTRTMTTQTRTTTTMTTTMLNATVRRHRTKTRPRTADVHGTTSSSNLKSWKAEQAHFLSSATAAGSTSARLDGNRGGSYGHGSRSINSSGGSGMSDEWILNGYEDLEQAPLQWADDDDDKPLPASRSIEYNIPEPVSSIAFPTSPDPSSSDASSLAPSPSTSSTSLPTSDTTVKTTSPPASFASPPARSSSRLPPRTLDKFQTIGRRAGMQQQQQQQMQGKHHRHTSLPHWPAQASSSRRNSVGQPSPLVESINSLDIDDREAHGTDDGTVTMSFRQRSIQSLRGIAAAWVPSVGSQSPRSTPSEIEVAKREDAAGLPAEIKRKHARLDRRRIDKAVSLAVEAAQASEQDEVVWKERQRKQSARLSNRSATLAATNGLELRLNGDHERASAGQGRSRAGLSSRFSSLPWRGSAAPVAEGALVPFREVKSATATPDSLSSAGDEKQPGLSLSSSDAEGEEEMDDDEDEDGFSMDLYISSLSYLLSALSPKEANAVGQKHREELKRKLGEALVALDDGDRSRVAAADRSDDYWSRELERHLALAKLQLSEQQRRQNPQQSMARMNSYGGQHDRTQSYAGVEHWDERAHAASQATKSRHRSRTSSIAGYIGSSALELALSVGAGALATAAKSVESFIPAVAAGSKEVEAEERVMPGQIAARPSTAPPQQSPPAPALFTNRQWDITMTLAGSAASSLYASLSAVAEQGKAPLPNAADGVVALDQSVAPEDQLMVLAASLARSVKRSPLPSQAAALAGQLGSLLMALDERYSLRKRSADVALRRTSSALGFVRKHDLHIKALRVTWAMAEATIAAIEAYRDEESWTPPPPDATIKQIESAAIVSAAVSDG